MKGTKHFSTIIVAALALSLGVRAAEQTPAVDAETRAKALEERVKVLEKRLAELEGTHKGDAVPQQRRGNRQRDAFAEMLERMQREMMEQGDGFDPRNMFGGDEFAAPMAPVSKPRLGVNLEKVSDELKTRFKNDVKDGAFVMSVLPDSPAQKSGLAVGDAITSFDGKAITTPASLIEAVKAAKKGSHELLVSRHGEALMLKAEFGDAELSMDDHGWLRHNGGIGPNAINKTEIKVSSLELTDNLTKELKLTDEQRKKMGDVLSKHSAALSNDFTTNFAPKSQRGVLGFSMTGDLNALAKKHADEAAKDLAGVLNEEQLKKWNDYRSTNSSVSFSQVIEQNGAPAAPVAPPPAREEKGFSF